MHLLRTLLNRIDAVVKSNNKVLDATGGRFNIFSVIGVTTEETRLHSAFIAELLNVNGTHGLKNKPLRAFIKTCLDDAFVFESAHAVCKVEHYIGPRTETTGGQIDIIVRDNCNRAIIIENKIYAGDQDSQMLRYFNHSKMYNESRLLYLSLDGKEPSDKSLAGADFPYKTLSYKFDIINWLTEVKMIAVDLPLVREALTHYLNLIKNLTNTSFMDKAKKEMMDIVMESPQVLQNALELEKVLTDVKIEIQWELWIAIQKALENKNLTVKLSDPKIVSRDKVAGYYQKSKNKDTCFGLWIEIYNQNGITMHWGCEVQIHLYTGFTIEKNGGGGVSDHPQFVRYRQIVTECDSGYRTDSANWLGWNYAIPKLNFREFNSQEIISLADKAYRDNIAQSIADKAFEDISFVLSKVNALSEPVPDIPIQQ